MSKRTAIVLGGGIAGLAAAIALDRAGYSVDVIERAPRIEPIGAALSLWSNAVDALAALGIAQPLVSSAAPIATIAACDRDGRAIMAPVAVSRAFLPTRTMLQQSLFDGLGLRTRLRFGSRWTDVADLGDAVTVRTADGRTLRASLVIDASGIHSPLANRLLDTRVTYRGYGGVLAISEPVSDIADGGAREFWSRGERFGVFDVGGGRRYWFYMRDAAADAGPPDLATCARIACDWPEALGQAIAATSRDALIPFSIHARTLPRKLGRGRILCIGDAAHAMEPNLGQGACQGIEDAAVLGALAASLPAEAIVPAFERVRLARLRRLMRQSAGAGRLVHRSGAAGDALRRLLPLIPAPIHRRQVTGPHRFAIPS